MQIEHDTTEHWTTTNWTSVDWTYCFLDICSIDICAIDFCSDDPTTGLEKIVRRVLLHPAKPMAWINCGLDQRWKSPRVRGILLHPAKPMAWIRDRSRQGLEEFYYITE